MLLFGKIPFYYEYKSNQKLATLFKNVSFWTNVTYSRNPSITYAVPVTFLGAV